MKVALWLMNRFQVDSSLTGDLIEEWATGRSMKWLLWQTCVAIMSALWTGLWHHKLRTLGAVAAGLFGWGLFLNAFNYALSPFPHFPIGLLLFVLRPMLLGWIVGRLQPTQPLGTALLFIAVSISVALWNSRHSPAAYGVILLLGSWLTLTTIVGGLLATRKRNSILIPG